MQPRNPIHILIDIRCGYYIVSMTFFIVFNSLNVFTTGFDVLLRNTVQDVSLGTISAVENLSILFWAKLFSVGTASATSLKLRDDSAGTILTINLAPEISVQAG